MIKNKNISEINFIDKNTKSRIINSLESIKREYSSLYWENMESMFYGCNSLSSIDLSNFNTQNVTNMEYMFSECNSLIYKIISNVQNN